MKDELIKLIQEYKDYCDSETKKLQKLHKGMIVAKPFTFDGFFEWLTTKG